MLKAALTSKILGDAGEHYALSRLAFAGHATAKMPDGWQAYDLAVHSATKLLKVSVKTRSETDRWKAGSWFTFDERSECDWLIFVFKDKTSRIRAWLIPFELARQLGNVPSARRKDPHMRDVSWSKLNKAPLAGYEDNWALNQSGCGQ
jgi:hypothetical protein